MFKNGIIAVLLNVIYFMLLGKFYWFILIFSVPVISAVIWMIEEAINDIKRKKAYHRRINRRINNIKISPTAGKHHRDI